MGGLDYKYQVSTAARPSMRNIVNAYGINIPLYLDDLVAWLSYEKESKKTNGEYINTATADREIVREREREREKEKSRK